MSFTSDWLKNYETKRALKIDPGPPVQFEVDVVTREADLHNKIHRDLLSRGWLPFHGAMSYRTHRTEGEPDFVCLTRNQRVLCIECKTRTGKVSPAQQDVICHASKLGHKIHVVRSFTEYLLIADAEEKEGRESAT